jgi:hypothetical protein
MLHNQPQDAGWSSLVARQAHNLKAAGSNPAPATNFPLGCKLSIASTFYRIPRGDSTSVYLRMSQSGWRSIMSAVHGGPKERVHGALFGKVNCSR